MLAKELWLTTNRLSSVILPGPALSNVWWPTRWKIGTEAEKQALERKLGLWLNSTLGLFSILMQRQETRGAWCKFPKAWYEELPVLDFRSLSQRDHTKLDQLWESVRGERFLPFPQMVNDTLRKRVDDIFSDVLQLPPMDPLRDLLAKEPLLSIR